MNKAEYTVTDRHYHQCARTECGIFFYCDFQCDAKPVYGRRGGRDVLAPALCDDCMRDAEIYGLTRPGKDSP